MSNSKKNSRQVERKIANYQESAGMNKSSQKEKHRLARKKLGVKRKAKKPRQNHWKRAADEWEDMEYEEYERIMPRGTLENRRWVEKLSADIQLKPEAQEKRIPDGERGRVATVSSGGCQVRLDEGGEMLACSLRGRLLEEEKGYSNAVAAGDRVVVRRGEDGQGVVEAVLPRQGVLARSDSHNRHQRQILAANIDQVVIVASWREPHFWPELVDRYLAATSHWGLRAVLCVNKRDLVEEASEYQAALAPYRKLGIAVLETSAVSGEGIAQLGETLQGKTSVVTGLSGAGKSTLLNAVQPGLMLRTGEVGQKGLNTNQGRHTTTQASYHALDTDGAVVDTPGIRDFGLLEIRPAELARHFTEMAALVGECKYRDCAHQEEEGCAVKEAVASGIVAASRYDSYLKILADLAD